MGVLIGVGTLALVAVIVQRMGTAVGSAPAWAAGLGQPAGTRILGVAAVDRLLGVWVGRPDGDRVLLVDPRGGRIAGELRLGE